jgi:hypothetical protein
MSPRLTCEKNFILIWSSIWHLLEREPPARFKHHPFHATTRSANRARRHLRAPSRRARTDLARERRLSTLRRRAGARR